MSHSYFIRGISIPYSDSACDNLGVIINHYLAFNVHFKNNIVSRARQRTMEYVSEVFTSSNNDILRSAFIIYISPIVEYNSTVWDPFFVVLYKSLERVQRSFD
jgi:hypothetical protein